MSMPMSAPMGAVQGYRAPRASRAPLASTSLDLLDRSRASLLQACRTGDAGERYVEAHLGALRAAAALLAARSIPNGASGAGSSGAGSSGAGSASAGRAIRASTSRSRPRSVWELLPRVAPELTEWSAFFAASARRRAAVERGSRITGRESDDLLRQAENFLEIIQDLLGLPRDAALAPISRYVAPVSRSGVVSGVGPGAGSAAGTRARPAGGPAVEARRGT
jgi:hypothetical protein